jgi:hypothetical protein
VSSPGIGARWARAMRNGCADMLSTCPFRREGHWWEGSIPLIYVHHGDGSAAAII